MWHSPCGRTERKNVGCSRFKLGTFLAISNWQDPLEIHPSQRHMAFCFISLSFQTGKSLEIELSQRHSLALCHFKLAEHLKLNSHSATHPRSVPLQCHFKLANPPQFRRKRKTKKKNKEAVLLQLPWSCSLKSLSLNFRCFLPAAAVSQPPVLFASPAGRRVGLGKNDSSLECYRLKNSDAFSHKPSHINAESFVLSNGFCFFCQGWRFLCHGVSHAPWKNKNVTVCEFGHLALPCGTVHVAGLKEKTLDAAVSNWAHSLPFQIGKIRLKFTPHSAIWRSVSFHCHFKPANHLKLNSHSATHSRSAISNWQST